MRKHKLSLLCLILFVLCGMSFSSMLRYYAPSTEAEQSVVIEDILLELNTVTATVDGVSYDITLPYTFTDLPNRTEVTITASFIPPTGYSFYIEAEYTPLQIYLDDSLVFEYGQDGSFPSSMMDPAAVARIVTIDEYNIDSEVVTLSITYLSPVTQSHFTVDQIYFGTQNDLYEMAFGNKGYSFLFSLTLILISLFLAFVTIFVTTFERRAFRILLLGTAGVLAGFWLLCDCTLTTLFISTPTQLYFISIYAMALFPVPLIWFALMVLELRDKRFLFTVAMAQLMMVLASIYLLQFKLVKSMIRVEQAFDILVPACVSLLATYVLYEYIRYRIVSLQRFALPAVMFALFTILEIANSRLSFANLPFSFFQAGIMVFMFSMGILAGLFMRDMLALQAETQQAAFGMQMMAYQADMLTKHSDLIKQTEDDLRKQRHDLRHQLTAIKQLADQQDMDRLQEYLNAVIQKVPSRQIFYCGNATVNAILSHYASICTHAGIELTVNVAIPEHAQDIHDTDYCVIFGNLLENAVEACGYLPTTEKRFVAINSSMRYNTLLIQMENSFDGHYKRGDGGVYRSRKRDANGIGLTSVQSIAEKHGGDAQFKPSGNVFTSSVYMTI